MNKTKYTSFRVNLEKIRFSIVGQVQGKSKSKKEQLNEPVADIVDDAMQSYDRQMILGLEEKDLKKLRLVEEAIKKLDDGQYGVCSECEELIPEGRLIVIPFASHCVNCLRMIESKNSGV